MTTKEIARARIVIADDHDDTRDMYADYLTANGFVVDRARNGAEVVWLAVELAPDLIVLDLHMPHMNGIDALRQIRRHAKTRRTPILVLTAYDVEEQDALSAGANAVCIKPCAPDALLKTIRGLLART